MGIRVVRAAAVVALGMSVLLVAGCTSGPTASIAALDTEVMLAVGEAEPKAVTEENVTASQGDVVSTDAAGLAEVGFPDGSFMRLGPDSEVTITELGSAEAQRTSITLDIGQTWHNVQELVAEDSVYEVVTPVGVASVRGTVFSVTCVEGPSCTFLVLDGEIDVDGVTLTPYERLILPEQNEPEILPVDALGDWVTDNIERDAAAEDAVALPDPPLEAASLAGTWPGTIVTTATNSTSAPVGTSDDIEWTLTSPECDDTCTITVSSTTGWEVDAPLVNGTITFTRSGTFECVFTETNEPSGETGTYTYEYVLNIAGADAGNQAASEVTGTITGTDTLDPQYTDCDMNTVDGSKTVTYERDVSIQRTP